MSSSVVSPAQWAGQLPHTNPTVDTAPSSRRAKPVSTKMTNGQGSNDGKTTKSISPVPTTSTRSTRSRRAVAYGESDSPELPAKPLPPVPATKPVIRFKKRSPPKRITSAKMSKTSSTDSQKTTSSESSSLRQPLIGDNLLGVENPSESEIVATATPEPVKADLPPNGSALKISFKSTANGGVKRLATSQDPDDGASSFYDVTPRISPTPDAATGLKGDVEVNGGGAPARAPRKKRKWLKRGEVDPDDPIAVAKQRDRHAMINQADEILLREIEAVRDGTHSALLALHAQLEVRKDIQLGYAKNRYDLKMAENMTVKEQAQTQARGDHHEASEQTLAYLNADLRRRKHDAHNEKLQIGRTADSYPTLSFGRGGKGWPIHTEKLISNQQTPMVEFQIDGQARQRKDHTVHLSVLSTSDARYDWDLIKFATRVNENEPPSSPDPRRVHIARADSPRRQPVAGPSRQVVAGPSQPVASSGPARNGIWPKNVYDVKDLPAYRAGSGTSVPMRQTPTHSPTPSRRPSPSPVAGPSVPRLPVASGSGSAYTTLTNGAGPSVPRAPHPQSFASVYSQR